MKHHSLITKAKTYIQEALSIDHLHTKYNRAQWQTVIPTKRTFHTKKKTKSKCWLLRSLLWSPGKLVIQFRDAEGILLYCSIITPCVQDGGLFRRFRTWLRESWVGALRYEKFMKKRQRDRQRQNGSKAGSKAGSRLAGGSGRRS